MDRATLAYFRAKLEEIRFKITGEVNEKYKTKKSNPNEQMADIADEIRDEWGIEKVAILHRIGRLEIGEVSVAVAVASPHRKDGFEACKYAMDRLKQIVPIWKREVWSDGEEEWVRPDPIYFENEEHNRD